jgi:hypothetical protein
MFSARETLICILFCPQVLGVLFLHSSNQSPLAQEINDLAYPLHRLQGAIAFHKMQQLQLSKDSHFPACSGTQHVIPRKILQNQKWPTNKWTKWCLKVGRGDNNVNQNGVFELNSCICTTDFQYLIITKGHDRTG